MALFVNVLSKTKTFTVYDDASNTSNEYKIGDIILNFVNTDTKKYFNKDKLLQKYDNSVVSRLFSKWDDYHAIFDCAIHYCFEKDIKSLNKLTTAQRYLLFSFFIYPNLSEMLELNIKVHSRCIPIGENIDECLRIRNAKLSEQVNFIKNMSPTFFVTYEIQSITDIMFLELLEMVKQNMKVKRCANNDCNKYFLVTSRSDTKYCEWIPDDGGKTCREIGAIKKYLKKIENDEFIKNYRREYKTRHARLQKKKYTSSKKVLEEEKQKLENWRKQAQSKIKEYKKKNDLEGYIEWLKQG